MCIDSTEYGRANWERLDVSSVEDIASAISRRNLILDFRGFLTSSSYQLSLFFFSLFFRERVPLISFSCDISTLRSILQKRTQRR